LPDSGVAAWSSPDERESDAKTTLPTNRMVEDRPGLSDRRISSPDWRTLSVAPKTPETKPAAEKRPPGAQRAAGSRLAQGQVAPPLLLAAVESPEAQSLNVPDAVAS